MSTSIKSLLNVMVLGGILLLSTAPVGAQTTPPAGATDFEQFLPAALTLLLPLGLILLISGAMPPEKAPEAAINLLVVWSVAALAYFGAGFAFQFGGIAQVTPNPELAGLYWEWYPLDQSVDVEVARLWGVIALRGWALSGEASNPAVQLLFLSHVSLVGAAALIPAGALLQQGKGAAAMVAGLFVGLFIYPVAGNWLWGGGWLSNLGANLGLAHGLVDFGGASVVFLVASGVTLAGLIAFRQNRLPSPDDEPPEHPGPELAGGDDSTSTSPPVSAGETVDLLEATPMPAAYLPILSVLGAGLVMLGWLGLATGIHNPTAIDFSSAHAAIAGLLAALAGALAAAIYSWFTTGRFDPLMTGRGLAAGWVVAVAGAPFIPVWLTTVSGAAVGLLLPLLIYLLDQKVRLGDSLGTLTTYGFSAVVSLLLVGFFADGQAGQGWNRIGATDYAGVEGQGVSGLVVNPGFAVDWPGQIQAQLLGMAVVLAWSLLLSLILFQIYLTVAKAWRRAKADQQRANALPPDPLSDVSPELSEENVSG